MANFFDQFDPPKKRNFFDALDPVGGASPAQPSAPHFELAELMATGAPSSSPVPAARPAPAAPPPVDPFAGESFGDLAGRRGQQFARGAATVAGSVPEAAALVGQTAEQAVKDMPSNATAFQIEQINEIDRMLGDPLLPEQGRVQLTAKRANMIEGIRKLLPEVTAMDQRVVTPASERETFKMGDQFREGVEDLTGAPDPRDTGFFAQVAEGGGNMAGIVALSALTGGAGGAAGITAAGAGLGASMNSADLYKEAKEGGASEEDALFAAKLGGVIGTTEIIPIGRALKFLPKAVRDKASSAMYRRLRDVVSGAGEEGAQEYLATVANNLVAQGVFDPDRQWSDGALEAAAVGAFLGGAIGGAGSFRGGRDEPPAPDAEPAPPVPPQPAPAQMQQPAAPLGGPLLRETLMGAPEIAPPPAPIPAPPAPEPQAVSSSDILPPQAEQAPPGLQPGEVFMESNVGPDGAALGQPVPGAFNEQTGQWRPLSAPPTPAAPQQQAAPEVSDASGFSPAPVEAATAPLQPQPTEMKAPRRKPKPLDPARPISAPVVSIIKQRGGIDPSSTIADDLRRAGVDQRRFPGLFKNGGMKGLDTIVAGEDPMAQELLSSVPEDQPGGGYFEAQDVFDAILEEAAGTPRRTDAQWQSIISQNERARETGFLPPEGEVDEAPEIDERISVLPAEMDLATPDERSQAIRASVSEYLTDIGAEDAFFTDQERMQIYADLDARGGPVEDVVDWWLSQEIEYVQADDTQGWEPAPFPPFGEIEGPASGGLQQAGQDAGAEAARPAGGQPDENAGSAQEPVAPQRTGTTDAGQTDLTPDGPQAVMPGFEQIPDRERAERQQDKPLRGGDAPPPSGGLFDEGARGTANFFDQFDEAPGADLNEKVEQSDAELEDQPAAKVGTPDRPRDYMTEGDKQLGRGEGAGRYLMEQPDGKRYYFDDNMKKVFEGPERTIDFERFDEIRDRDNAAATDLETFEYKAKGKANRRYLEVQVRKVGDQYQSRISAEFGMAGGGASPFSGSYFPDRETALRKGIEQARRMTPSKDGQYSVGKVRDDIIRANKMLDELEASLSPREAGPQTRTTGAEALAAALDEEFGPATSADDAQVESDPEITWVDAKVGDRLPTGPRSSPAYKAADKIRRKGAAQAFADKVGGMVTQSTGNTWGVVTSEKISPERSVDVLEEVLSDYRAGRLKPEPVEADPVAQAAAEADTAPTDGQKEAGNYRMGHTKVQGLDITIENAAGSTRSGTGAGGKAWSVEMPAHYGYIKRTEGADGDHVDVYVGPDTESDQVFVVDQMDADTGQFDEHKVIMGVADRGKAMEIYEGGFSDGRAKDRLGGMTKMNVADFKRWLETEDQSKPIKAVPKTPSASEAAKSAAKNTTAALDEAVKGLTELFGGQGRLSSGLTFDEDTYKAAKPHFQAALSHFAAAGADITAAAKALVKHLRETAGWDRSMFEAQQPYLARFLDEFADGKITPTEAERTETNEPDTDSQSDVQSDEPGSVQGPASERKSSEASRPSREESDAGSRSGAVGNADAKPGTAGGRRARDEAGGGRSGGTDQGRRGRSPRRSDNFRIAPGSLNDRRGDKTRANDSLAAIQTLKKLEAEGRRATKEEQAKLSLYAGGGSLAPAIPGSDGRVRKGYEDLADKLSEVTTDEERATMARSTQYAFYTSEDVVRGMWRAVERMGFKTGTVFEPGMGIGHFAGMAPESMANTMTYRGLEMDHITARIARQLYPDHRVIRGDYSKIKQPDGFYDLAIGNPPFGSIEISDKRYPQKFLIHDYFFAKTIDTVRPGGLLAFVTSEGTMNKSDDKARRYLSEKADLIGAIRLPNTAFKGSSGTEVTTDILFMKRREDGAEPGGEAFLNSTAVKLPSEDGAQREFNVNEYFQNHPEMILGEQGGFATMRFANQYGVRPSGDLETQLKTAIDSLPTEVFAEAKSKTDSGKVDDDSGETKPGSYYVKDGKLMAFDGFAGREVKPKGKSSGGTVSAADYKKIQGFTALKMSMRDTISADLSGDLKKAESARKLLNKRYDAFVKEHGPINKQKVSYSKARAPSLERARAKLREEALAAGEKWDDGSFDPGPMLDRKDKEGNAKPATMTEIAKERDRVRTSLGKEYNDGSFNPDDVPDVETVRRLNLNAFMSDPEVWRLAALENYDATTGTATKSKLFTEPTVAGVVEPKIETPADALSVSLARFNRVDLDFIGEELGLDSEAVLANLPGEIFLDPTDNVHVIKDQYLSGNVRAKLAEAMAAAEKDPSFFKNVTALQQAMPPEKTEFDVTAAPGMSWITPEDHQDFSASIGMPGLRVTRSEVGGRWKVQGGDLHSTEATVKWGTTKLPFPKLFEAVLNRTPIKITKKVMQGDKPVDVFDEAASKQAEEKGQEIVEAFKGWVWKDDARKASLLETYNERFNSHVAPSFDGSYLTTPGIAKGWKWRPHQQNVIARMLQTGNTYLAHAVGAGKTSEMIAGAMEMRRLGLARKPMITVPNHMLGQFAAEFYDHYPQANLAIADDYRFHTDRRREFIADIAANDYDSVIITHSAFEKIAVSPEFTDQFVQREVARFESAMRAAKLDGDRITVKNMEMMKERMENRLLSKVGARKDDQLSWEETGVDALFVDEAHLFRKLDFATQLGNTKGITPQGSQAAWDLFMKTRSLEQVNPGRGVYFASGTPITNTMAEVYTVSRFMQNDELVARGMEDFDSWAQTYGSTSTDFEPDASGNYKPVTRFSQFVNAGDLSMMLRQVMDVVISEQLEQYVVRPELETGARVQVVVDRTEDVADYQQELASRMAEIEKRTGPPKKGDDNILVVTGDGIAAATDMRLVKQNASGKGSKLTKLAENVLQIYRDTRDHPFYEIDHEAKQYKDEPAFTGGAAQMVFADIQRRGGKTTFDTHKFIRDYLVERGVPADQIALFREFKTMVAKARLFNQVNDGEVAILIGSARQMGTGVNAQRRLYAMHNLDPHWFPAIDEQRVGRIVRQGNMNRTIRVNDYATHGTYDSTMWQMMGRKASFIQDFLRGDPNLNEMEDIGSASVYDQIAGMTTPDPRVLQLKELKETRKKLERRRANKAAEKRSMAKNIDEATKSIEVAQDRLSKWKPLLDSHVDLRGDAFVASVGDATFKSRKEFGEALEAAADKVTRTEKRGAVAIGTVSDFPIKAEYRKGSMDGELFHTSDVFIEFAEGIEEEFTIHVSPADTAKAMTALLNSIPSKVEAYEDQIEAREAEIMRIKDLQRSFVEFQDEGQLEETTKAADALEATLKGEADAALKKKQGKKPEEAKELRGQSSWSDIGDEADLRARLDAAGLKRVKLGWTEARTDVKGVTQRQKGRVSVLLNPALADQWTLDHETIHAMKMMGLFTPAEWSVLEDRARNSWMRQYKIASRYGDLPADHQREEAIAEAFADAASKSRKPTGRIKTAFNKIARLLRAIKAWAKGQGFQTAEDIFAKIEGGEFSNRDAAAPRGNAVERHLRAAPGGKFHVPDETVAGSFREATGWLSGIRAGMSAEALSGSFDRARTALQDKMLPALRVQRAIEEATGAPIADDANIYLTEETYTGRVGFRLAEIEREYIEPALHRIAKSNDLNTENVGEYLYALHAEERNKHIASINPAMPDGGSGMATAKAKQIIAAMEGSADGKDAKAIAEMMQQIRQKSLDARVEYGLLSKDEAKAWAKKYQWYVPLKGFAETDGADGSLDTVGVGKAYNVSGAETRRAMGRKSEAFNPLMAAITQAQEAVIRGEKNRIGQALHKLVSENPSGDLWEVKKVKNKRYFNQSTGLIDTYAQSPITYPQSANEVALKIEGKEHRIIIHDERLLKSITEIGADGLGALTRISRSFTQFLSMMNTMFSPSFIVVNAVRDYLTAHVQAPAISGDDAKGIMKEVRKNYRKALVGAYGGIRGKRNTEWQKNYAEFASAGGKIEFFKIETPEELNRTLERRMRLMTKEGRKGDSLVMWQQSAPFKFVENLNLAVDNAMRLAAFKAARDRGWSADRAASLSKNLTVNFNRRGSMGSAINAYIMFYNAGMQGFHMLANAAQNQKSRRIMYAIAALGMLEDQIMSAFSEEDDDGELAYDKLLPYQRSMNFVVMGPGTGGGALVPLPYGYNIFAYAGKQASRISRGGVSMKEALIESYPEIFNSVSPPIVPTLYEPYRAWTQNENWLGRPIRPEYAFSDFGPKSERAYASTSELSQAAARMLNRASGGDEFHSGAIDIAPGYMDHFAGWIAGGVGRTAIDLGKAATSVAVDGEAPEVRNIPIVDRLVFQTNPWLDSTAYYNRREKVKEAQWVLKNGGPSALSDSDQKLLKAATSLKASEKVLRGLRKQRRAINDDERLSRAERRKRLEALDKAQEGPITRFNRAYLAAQ